MPNSIVDAPSDTRPIPPRFWWLKRIGVAVGVLLVALGALRWWWGWEANRRFQERIAHYRALGQPVLLEDFRKPAVPDEQNAAHFLRKAAAAVTVPDSVTLTFNDILTDPRLCRQHPREARDLFEANREALRLARQARARSAVDWNIRIASPVFNILLPHLSGQRTLSKLLCSAALYSHERRNDAEAIEILRDILRCSDAVAQDSALLISHLVSLAISAIAANGVENLAPTLRVDAVSSRLASPGGIAGRAQVRALIAELLDERPSRAAALRAFYWERMAQLDTVQWLYLGPLGQTPWPLRFAFGPAWLLDAIDMMDRSTAFAEASQAPNWPAAKDLFPTEPELDSGFDRLVQLMSSILWPALERSIESCFHALTKRRMAATALAIRLFELDHGRRPERLSELVPEYLPALPGDPFADAGGTLVYRPDRPSPILYSVGPDGKDDRGAYTIEEDGSLGPKRADLLFFLNGDRPRPMSDFESNRLREAPDDDDDK
ncbi:MAG: hypothetical protein IH986_01725 [Planctomycetes bacterium]|nr:hypothetical protein [Planctomycetota bacterium]